MICDDCGTEYEKTDKAIQVIYPSTGKVKDLCESCSERLKDTERNPSGDKGTVSEPE